MGQRIQLRAPAREMARVAATIGREFTFAVLIRASEFDEDTHNETRDTYQ